MVSLTKQYASTIIDDDFKLSFMTINVGLPSKKAEERKAEVKRQSEKYGKKLTQADIRRDIFINKIKYVDPDIICFQEQIDKDMDETDKSMLGEFLENLSEEMKDKYNTCYERQASPKQAAVMVKKSMIDEEKMLKKIDFIDSDTKKFSEIRARMVLIKVALANTQSIYIASWHGPHKSKGKADVANKVMQIVKGKVGSSPYIIGGDFNLPRKDFPENYTSVADEDSDIDYFVYGGTGCKMTGVKKLSYDEKFAGAFLDHVPISGEFVKE